MIQGGDFTKRNGTGGESIYGGTFADEDLTRPLDSEGLLCMANKGPNTNGSQFFITLRDCPHLNGKHVVFGRVIRGYEEVVKQIAAVPVDEKDRPQVPVTIANCGELVLRAKVQSQEPEAKPAARAASESESERSGDEEHRHRKKRRHRGRDGVRDSGESNSEDEHRHKKSKHKSKSKSKSKHKKAGSRSPSRKDGNVLGDKPNPEPEEETEEQYDARLEREEKERIEAAKRRELERLKRRLEEENSQTTNGVRFKGRGRMKYVDPEIRGHRDD